MDKIGDNLSMENKSLVVNIDRPKKQRRKLEIEKKQSCRKQRRRFAKSTSPSFPENLNCYSAGFRYSNVTDNPCCDPSSSRYPKTVGHVPCEGNNYFTYVDPRCKNPHVRKGEVVFNANEYNEIDNHQALKGSGETNAMRIMREEMKELKEKLSALVETLSNVVDALVKTTGEPDEEDGKFNRGSSKAEGFDFGVREKTVRELGNEKADRLNGSKIKSRSRGRSGFCCLGARSVRSTESDSDYYRPERSHESKSKFEKKDHQKSVETSVSEYQETASLESRGSRTCQHVTVCYWLQQLLYRTKHLVF